MRPPDYFDRYDADEQEQDPRPPRCNRCGSTDVRWRQQTGKWVLFSSTPGYEHECPTRSASPDEFD